jgi:hypothetical protein
MKKILPLAAAMIALSLSSSAFANTYTWNLVGPTSQILGMTDIVTSMTGNISMVFSGFVTNATDVATSNTWMAPTAQASALYAKNSGGDEIGLGMNADPSGDHEIFPNSFVQIDIAGVIAQKQINSLQLLIGSVQSGEGFSIWGSNTANQPGTLLMKGTSLMDDVAFNVPSYGSYRYISVGATSNNILLDSVTAASSGTPEPGTLGLGMIACIGLFAKKLLQRTAK